MGVFSVAIFALKESDIKILMVRILFIIENDLRHEGLSISASWENVSIASSKTLSPTSEVKRVENSEVDNSEKLVAKLEDSSAEAVAKSLLKVCIYHSSEIIAAVCLMYSSDLVECNVLNSYINSGFRLGGFQVEGLYLKGYLFCK